jgi:hypothetical protein
MHYIFEALFVGIYCGILYEILVNFIGDYYVLLWVLGFFKHFLGYELHLHSMFCKYGYACQRVANAEHRHAEISNLKIIIESMIEGIVFVIVGYLLSLIMKDRLVMVFWIGVILHISAELIGIHQVFCQRCVINYSAPLFEPLMFHETN